MGYFGSQVHQPGNGEWTGLSYHIAIRTLYATGIFREKTKNETSDRLAPNLAPLALAQPIWDTDWVGSAWFGLSVGPARQDLAQVGLARFGLA